MHRQAREHGYAALIQEISERERLCGRAASGAGERDQIDRILPEQNEKHSRGNIDNRQKFGGKVPDSMEKLRELPGVGRKTANVVLGNAFGINEGIVVDTHVIRLSQRLGLTKQKDPEKIEQDLMKLVPKEHWTNWSHWLIWHGRRRCYARKPDCANCEVFRLCPSGKVFLRTGVARKPEAVAP